MIFKERRILKIIGGILFTSFFSLLVIIAALVPLTEHDNLKPIFSSLISKQLTGEQLSQVYSAVLLYCEKSQAFDMPLDIEKITLQCKDVKSAGQNGFPDLVAGTLFDKIYYKEYNCSFMDCINQSPLVIISLHANAFLKDMMYLFALVSLISAVILAISSRGWGIVKSFGTSLTFIGLSYFVIVFSKSLIPPQIMDVGGQFINSVLDAIAFSFLIVLIAGIALTAIWFVFGRKSTAKKK